MSESVLNKLCKMILLSHLGRSCLDNSRLVPETSHIGQSFLGTNQAILLLIQKKKNSERQSR